MSINWFTFFAQIVNFLILVVLLQRFLYGPIVRAMDAREAALQARFHEAAQATERATAEAAAHHQARVELEQQRAALLVNATTAAEERRRAMIGEARTEVETMMSRWYDDVAGRQTAYLETVRNHLTGAVVGLSERALADLAGSDLEQQMVIGFVARLRGMPADQRHALIQSGGDFAEAVVLASSFELPLAARQQLVDALQQLVIMDADAYGGAPLNNEISVRFRRNPELICGIELLVRDRRIAWSMRDYVDAYADELNGQLAPDTVLAA